MRQFCYLMLTCDANEKESIAKVLLDKRLIVCAKFIPVNAMYWWQGSIANDDEAMMLMESAEDLFDAVEQEVGKIHSYETFVLTQIPITNVSKDARKWMEGELS